MIQVPLALVPNGAAAYHPGKLRGRINVMKTPQDVTWLRAPLICDGQTVRPGLLPNALSDNDLPDICVRMHLILDTIEFERCEGRLINLDIFEPIDTLESDLRHRDANHLAD